MLRNRVNVSEKVAALEALLERVQRNAAEPRPPRSDIAATSPHEKSPAFAAQEAPADSLSDWAVSSISPVLDVKPKPAVVAPSTAPYPVMKESPGLTPPGPQVSPLSAAAATAKRPEPEPSPISAWPDIGPPSYPTLPGIAGPPQRAGASKVMPIAVPAPPPQTRPAIDETTEAVTVQSPALQPVSPLQAASQGEASSAGKAPEPAAIVPPEQARPDRSAVIRTLPGVGLEQTEEEKPARKLPDAVAAAQAAKKTPAAKTVPERKPTPPGFEKATPAAAAQKPAPTAAAAAPKSAPKAPETPATAKAGASLPTGPATTAAKTPALAPIKSPLVSLPKRPLSTPSMPAATPAPKAGAPTPAPGGAGVQNIVKPSALSLLGGPLSKYETPKAPPAKSAEAAKEAAQKLGIEPPPAVLAAAKNLGGRPAVAAPVDSDDSMATTIDFDESPTARPHEVQADEMTKPAPSPAAKAAAPSPAGSAKAREEEAEAEEATVMRTSPLESVKVKEEAEESPEEPTLMRPSPLDALSAQEKEEAEESSEEPTLMRPSPLETQPGLPEAAKELSKAAEQKPALAKEETKGEPAPDKAAAGEEALPPLAEPLFSPELQPRPETEQAAPDTVRPERKPGRRAPLWGFALAALALAGAGIVVAVDKGWVRRFVEPSAETSAPSVTATAPETPTKTTASPEPSPSLSAVDAQAPVPEESDAGALLSDAGLSDASVSDAAAEDAAAPDAAAPDAAAPDAAAPDAAAPATSDTSAPSVAAPAGDPAALPEKKGYLTVKSAPSLHVYVQGAHAGLTNEALVVDCGPKFVRLGEPPATPGPGLVGVKWRSEGKSVVVACKSTTEMNLPATP